MKSILRVDRPFALGLPVLLLLASCSRGTVSDDVAAEPDRQPVPVQAVVVQQMTLRPQLDLVGTVVAIPERTALVSPQLGGWVKKLAVVEGQMVKAGDLLVQLDSRSARTEIDRAQATVAEKKATLKRLQRGYLPQEIEAARENRDEAKATADGLRSALAALDDLRQRREISPVAYETKAKALEAAEAALASADAHLQQLEAGTPTEMIDEAQALLDVAKADLNQAKLTLEWCSITSPLDGMVVALSAHPGQFFDRAVSLATIIDLSNVFVQLRIPSRECAKVQLGTEVRVGLHSIPDQMFQGTVHRISGEADKMTGNLIVFALVTNSDRLLRPGLGCQVRVSLPEVADALAIPVAAVAADSGTPVVTAIRDGKAYETEVQLGAETRELVQVLQGLAPGEMVATLGGYGLPEGCPVKIITGDEASQPHEP